ncbi:glycosyltransferase family 9 protein [bacterium]|nr:glycosyltransferase family 9 protein [bacterium]
MKSSLKNTLIKFYNPLIKKPVNKTSEAPPLVIRFGALGDMILTTPLLRALAERHKQPCEIIGRGSFPAHVFNNLPFVWSVRTIDSNKTPYVLNLQKQALVEWLRNRPKGPVYLLQSDVISHKIFEKANVEFSDSDLSVERRINEHVIDHMARLGGFTDKNGEISADYKRGTELRIAGDEKSLIQHEVEKLEFEIRDVIVIQPGFRKCMNNRRRQTKGKFWPEEKWIRLIQEILITAPEKRVILSGSTEEQPLVCAIADAVNDHRVSELILPLRPLFSLISQAHSMISLDTGPAHAAAALNCPLVVLFGKMDPRVIRPISLNSPVEVIFGPPDAPLEDDLPGWQKHHSMDEISVQNVVDAWINLQ